MDGQLKATPIIKLKRQNPDIHHCSKAHLVLERSSAGSPTHYFRIVLVCRFDNEVKLLIFGYTSSSSAPPRTTLTLPEGSDVTRLEGVLFKRAFFLAYQTTSDLLYYTRNLIDTSIDTGLQASDFSIYQGILS